MSFIMTGKCEECNEVTTLDQFEEYVCEHCRLNSQDSEIMAAIEELTTKEYIWKDEEGYQGFETEKSKALYMKGVKYGYFQALFWLADYFGKVDEYEKLQDFIETKEESQNEKINNDNIVEFKR